MKLKKHITGSISPEIYQIRCIQTMRNGEQRRSPFESVLSFLGALAAGASTQFLRRPKRSLTIGRLLPSLMALSLLLWLPACPSDSGSDNGNGNGNGNGGSDTDAPSFAALGVSFATTTSIAFAATVDEDADIYWVLLTSGADAPSVTQVQTGADSAGRAATEAASEVVAMGRAPAEAGVEALFTASGLTEETSYDLYAVAQDGAGNSSAVESLPGASTLSTIEPPFARTPRISGRTATTISFTVNMVEASVIHWVLLTTGADAPSSAQVEAGTDSADRSMGDTDSDVAASGMQAVDDRHIDVSIEISGLSVDADYDLYMVGIGSASQNRHDFGPVLTGTVAAEAPTLANVRLSEVTATTATVSVTAAGARQFTDSDTFGNKNIRIFWLAVPEGGRAPSTQEVLDQVSNIDSVAVIAGGKDVISGSAGRDHEIMVTGLDASTAYTIYLVAQYVELLPGDTLNSGTPLATPEIPVSPTIVSALTVSASEALPIGIVIVNLRQAVMGESSVTYQIIATPGEADSPYPEFALVGSNIVTTSTALDFETTEDYLVTVSIVAQNARGSVSGNLSLTINVVDIPGSEILLIPVTSKAQLQAIAYDLDGDGTVDDSANQAAYDAAFPSIDCPTLGCIGYELMNDIDLGGDPTDPASAWTPIAGAFRTILQGGGFTLSNLYIRGVGDSQESLGLFNRLRGAQIRDLTLSEVQIDGMFAGSSDNGTAYIGAYIGSLAGRASETLIQNVVVEDSDSDSNSGSDTGLQGASSSQTVQIIGGLIGNMDSGTIVASRSNVEINSGNNRRNVGSSNYNVLWNSHIGGLLGRAGSVDIISSSASGAVNDGTGNANIGGLVGYQSGGSITASFATGQVNGDNGNDGLGGLMGRVYLIRIIASYATGNVNGGSGADRVGGLVASIHNSQLIANYATGNADAGDGDEWQRAHALLTWVGGDGLDPNNDCIIDSSQDHSCIVDSYGFGNASNATGGQQHICGGCQYGNCNPENSCSSEGGNGIIITLLYDLPAAGAKALNASNTPDTWSTDVWDFGDNSQAAALKYVNSFSPATDSPTTGTYNCSASSFLPLTVACGATLLPGPAGSPQDR